MPTAEMRCALIWQHRHASEPCHRKRLHVSPISKTYGEAIAAQVAERVRIDKRVTVLERTNVRYVTLEDMPGRQPAQLATLDLSFISVLKVLPAVCSVLAPDAALIVLIKPQFEASRSEVSKLCTALDACRQTMTSIACADMMLIVAFQRLTWVTRNDTAELWRSCVPYTPVC